MTTSTDVRHERAAERLRGAHASGRSCPPIRDLPAEDTPEAVQRQLGVDRAEVDTAVAALEIVDSRVAGWDIRLVGTVADNACGLSVGTVSSTFGGTS